MQQHINSSLDGSILCCYLSSSVIQACITLSVYPKFAWKIIKHKSDICRFLPTVGSLRHLTTQPSTGGVEEIAQLHLGAAGSSLQSPLVVTWQNHCRPHDIIPQRRNFYKYVLIMAYAYVLCICVCYVYIYIYIYMICVCVCLRVCVCVCVSTDGVMSYDIYIYIYSMSNDIHPSVHPSIHPSSWPMMLSICTHTHSQIYIDIYIYIYTYNDGCLKGMPLPTYFKIIKSYKILFWQYLTSKKEIIPRTQWYIYIYIWDFGIIFDKMMPL